MCHEKFYAISLAFFINSFGREKTTLSLIPGDSLTMDAPTIFNFFITSSTRISGADAPAVNPIFSFDSHIPDIFIIKNLSSLVLLCSDSMLELFIISSLFENLKYLALINYLIL